MKIYAIDDEPIHLLIYERAYGATTFQSPGALIDALCREQPDLLISDLMMPKVDGWTIVSIARNIYPDLPIIIGTSMDDFVQKQCAKHKGCLYWIKGAENLPTLRQLVEEIRCTKLNGKQ